MFLSATYFKLCLKKHHNYDNYNIGRIFAVKDL